MSLPVHFHLSPDKARARTGKVFPLVVIQEAGLDGLWIDRVLQNEGIESHVVDPASIAISRRRRRAKTDKIDGETLVRSLLAYKRGEPRVCSMVKPPTPEEEDQRWLCRERKVLTAERVLHVNRIKGLLFCQGICGYEPLRAIGASGSKNSRPAMAVHYPRISKRKSNVNSIGSNCCSSRSKPWRASGTRCWPRQDPLCRRRRRCCST
jgi:transposase